MHYSFDILSSTIFIAALFILWAQRWQFSSRYRGIYGLVIITGIYLVGALYFAFSWHARTGLSTIVPFPEFDTFYFVSLSIVLGFLMLYFADISVGRAKYPALIFVIPAIMVVLFLIVNPQTGLMFTYEHGHYERGPLLILNYIVWFSYMLAMVVMVLRARVRLGKKTVYGLLLFFAYELGLQVFQHFFVDFYIGGITFSTGLLYLVIAPLFLEPGRNELTGLYNREGFFNIVREVLRLDPHGDYYLIAIDINNFRAVNDRFGFEAGNRVLAYVGSSLKAQYPDTESIAYFDSDHFFICCPRDKAVLALPDIPITACLPEVQESFTVSLYQGVYPIESHDEDVSRMCDLASFALQQVKGNYHNKTAFFDKEAREKLQYKNYLVQAMQTALKDHKFKIVLQPVVDVRDSSIIGAEALLRWEDDNYGTIFPKDFIPLYEENGSISELDLFVCKEVCQCITSWKSTYNTSVPVSVNVSRASLHKPGFFDEFAETVAQEGVSPEEIRIEITESAFVDIKDIEEQLEEMHRKGFVILMDDFGSGYSSFNTFALLPVDNLKIDVAFMSNLDYSERGRSVFSCIVDMARKLSMPIVVEGVETQRQKETLQDLDIRYAQGFYYARPMPVKEFESKMFQSA